MNILGIDPGTIKMGYGVLSLQGGVVAFGTIILPVKAALTVRNQRIFHEVKTLIAQTQAQALVIETQFVGVNVQSTMVLSMARGVAMLAATELAIPVFTYGPTEVKQAVTGKGNAPKSLVQSMVGRRLGLAELPDEDAADALALALCYLQGIQTKHFAPQQA